MGFKLYTALVLAASAVTVLGLPGGAPLQACMEIAPAHGNPPNQAVGENPFYVNTSDIGEMYMPDTTYTIVLSGSEANMNFRGFLIQARAVADDSPVGQFTFDNNQLDQQTQCVDSTGATHTNNDEKTEVMLTWVAPSNGTGTIYFRFAFVDVYMTGVANMFWANLTTPMIAQVGGPTLPPTTAPTTMPTTMPTTGTTQGTTQGTTAPTTAAPGDNGSSGLMAGAMLTLLLSTVITLFN